MDDPYYTNNYIDISNYINTYYINYYINLDYINSINS